MQLELLGLKMWEKSVCYTWIITVLTIMFLCTDDDLNF